MRNHCAKCGDMRISVKYDKVLDMLNLKCERCGHEWTEYPNDASQQRLQAAMSARAADPRSE